jgi:hypothetical protein
MNWKNTVTVISGATTGIVRATLELLRNEGSVVYNLDNAPSAQPVLILLTVM